MLVAIVTAISGVAGMAAVAIGRRWPVAGPSAEATHLVYLLRTHPALAAADLWAALWGAAHATSFSTAVFRVTTQLGATVTIVVVGSVVGVVVALRSRRVSPLLFVALVLGGNAAIVNLIKVLVDRAHPAVSVLTGFTGRSFPSGRSAGAAACYGTVALLLSLRGHRRIVRPRTAPPLR